jgi:hypothetical protein
MSPQAPHYCAMTAGDRYRRDDAIGIAMAVRSGPMGGQDGLSPRRPLLTVGTCARLALAPPCSASALARVWRLVCHSRIEDTIEP